MISTNHEKVNYGGSGLVAKTLLKIHVLFGLGNLDAAEELIGAEHLGVPTCYVA